MITCLPPKTLLFEHEENKTVGNDDPNGFQAVKSLFVN